MSKINPDNNFNANKLDALRKESKKSDDITINDRKNSNTVSVHPKKNDSIDLSQNAKKLLQKQATFNSDIDRLNAFAKNPNSNFKDVYSKIQSSFYNTPELIDDLAEAVLNSGSLASAKAINVSEKASNDNRLSKRLNDIKKNISEGKYFSDEVTEKISDKILNNLF